MTGPSREEFYQAINSLRADIREDIGGINDRLDTLNGRTGKGEVDRAELKQRLVGVEKELFNRPRRRAEEIADQRDTVSRKDIGLASLGLALVAAAAKLLLMAGNFALETLKTVVHKGP